MSDGLFVPYLNAYFSERDLPTTTYALLALSRLGGLSSINLESPIQYAVRCQQTDGGFSSSPTDTQSDLVATSQVVSMLDAVDAVTRINRYAAISWIVSLQRSDGGFDNSPYLGHSYWVWNTASALETLQQMGATSFPNQTGIVDNVLSYHHAGGGFSELPNGGASIVGTYWSVRALHILDALNQSMADETAEYLCRNYDAIMQTFSPRTLAGFHQPCIALKLLNELVAINASAAIAFCLSLQSPLHGAFVTSPDELLDARRENVWNVRDAIDLLFALGGQSELDETFEVEEIPIWQERTTSTLPPPPSPEAIVILMIVLAFAVTFGGVFLLSVTKPKSKRKTVRKKKRS
jgi:prenyltransferase beta subunit